MQLQGDGAVRLLVVECDAQLALRATAQWNAAAEALPGDASLFDLAGGPQHGRLAITLDPKDGGPIYQGIVGLEATSIARLFEHYLATSEQIASRMLWSLALVAVQMPWGFFTHIFLMKMSNCMALKQLAMALIPHAMQHRCKKVQRAYCMVIALMCCKIKMVK